MEEKALTGHVREMRMWLGVRDELTQSLERQPTDDEWARSLGISDIPSLSAEQVLRAQIREKQLARDELVLANLRLVVSTAKRYQYDGLPLQDLVQEGAVGLIKAGERLQMEI